jgi:2,3-bisphosphoglycerate-dependent phosphoglycerate mutase
MAWRRNYDAPPPTIAPDNALQRTMEEDPRYEPYPGGIPATESLADVCKRVWPLWEDTIQPSLRAGRTVMHGQLSMPVPCMLHVHVPCRYHADDMHVRR